MAAYAEESSVRFAHQQEIKFQEMVQAPYLYAVHVCMYSFFVTICLSYYVVYFHVYYYVGINQTVELRDLRIAQPSIGIFVPQRVCIPCYFEEVLR